MAKAEIEVKITDCLIRCKDCRHYAENFFAGDIIVSHNICTRWGDGCVTTPEGYCFLAKRRDADE